MCWRDVRGWRGSPAASRSTTRTRAEAGTPRRRRQRQAVPVPAYWKVIFAAAPVFDGPAPAMVWEAKLPNRLAVRKAPPARSETKP